jgi:ribosomal protein L16 Arg81 hydroxylase
VYLPLTRLWQARGLTWQRVYPILFLSGPGCSTNYHWDPSSVLIVQLHGRKRFHSLTEPRRWCPEEVLALAKEGMVRPEGLTAADIQTCELGPGEAVWSPCRAPHWLDAYEETAFTLSIAFTDIQPGPYPDAQMLVL